MVSQLAVESMRNSSGKPLNPNAKEFYPRLEISHQLDGEFNQMPPWPFPYGPICTYYQPCFGCFSASKGLKEEFAARIPECKAEEDVGERMIGNTKGTRYMSQKKNRPREHGSRWEVERKVQRDGHSIFPFPTSMGGCIRSRTTTVMIKNIPYHFQFNDLVMILDEHCSLQNLSSQRLSSPSMYDFVYLPMDYQKYAHDKSQSNLGYAFVNFTSPRAAFRFFQQFNGHKWAGNEKWKVCEVTKAFTQGKVLLKKRFEEKVFRCGNPSFRPVEFRPARDGVNRGMEEIRVGIFQEGLPCTNKPRTLPKQ